MRNGVGALIGAACLWHCVDDMSISGVPPGSAGRFGASVAEANDTVLIAPTGAGASASGGPSADAAPPASFGPVQCGASLGCSSVNAGARCRESVPGGVCVGCGDGDTCPAGAACVALGQQAERQCVRPCAAAADCNAGLACSDGHCVPRSCREAADCPSPYLACREGQCSRPRCDQAFCPPELICAGSGFCVEPELAE